MEQVRCPVMLICFFVIGVDLNKERTGVGLRGRIRSKLAEHRDYSPLRLAEDTMNRRRFRWWRRTLMRRLILVPLGCVFLVTLVVFSLTDTEVEIGSAGEDTIPVPRDGSLRFVLLGDTGGLPLMHETRAQKHVARRLAEMAQNEGLDGVITMGDNIYYTGVDNEFDSRFESSFERPYEDKRLDGQRFYMIAGNHDHFGNISAQIAYTKYSRKWYYPALYYNFSLYSKDGAQVEFIMIDTIVLCGNTKDIEFSGFWKMLFTRSVQPGGPVNRTAAELQWKWIEERLNASTAPYLFVVGHYPTHSVSSHGPIKCMAERLIPLLHKYNATAYVAGHDHTLQHITYPSDNGRTLHYIVSGAGSRSDPSKKHMDTIQPPGKVNFHFPRSGTIIKQLGVGEGGFIAADLTAQRCFLRFLTSKGNQEYAVSLSPR